MFGLLYTLKKDNKINEKTRHLFYANVRKNLKILINELNSSQRFVKILATERKGIIALASFYRPTRA